MSDGYRLPSVRLDAEDTKKLIELQALLAQKTGAPVGVSDVLRAAISAAYDVMKGSTVKPVK